MRFAVAVLFVCAWWFLFLRCVLGVASQDVCALVRYSCWRKGFVASVQLCLFVASPSQIPHVGAPVGWFVAGWCY